MVTRWIFDLKLVRDGEGRDVSVIGLFFPVTVTERVIFQLEINVKSVVNLEVTRIIGLSCHDWDT